MPKRKHKGAYKKAGKDEPLEGWVATRGAQALLESRCVEASLREVQGLARPRNKKEECLQMEQAIAASLALARSSGSSLEDSSPNSSSSSSSGSSSASASSSSPSASLSPPGMGEEER